VAVAPPIPDREFTCLRSRQVNVILGVVGLLLFGGMAAAYLSETARNNRAALTGSICVVLALAMLGYFVRSLRASSIRLDGEELLYRAVLKDLRFERAEIAVVTSEVRLGSSFPRRWAAPEIATKDGRVTWCTAFSVPPSVPGRDRKEAREQSEMIEAIMRWLNA